MALLSLEEIHDVAVIGVPSDLWGETPVAFIIPAVGHPFEEKIILSKVNSKLNKFQRIHKIIERTELPKSPIGKILKRQLRAEWTR